jgi:hypothetical protein
LPNLTTGELSKANPKPTNKKQRDYFHIFFYIIEGLSPEEKDYKAIKRGVLNPITSTKNKFLILLGQVSKKTMLQSRIQLILANASAHLFASR